MLSSYSNPYRRCLEQAIKHVSNTISLFLETVEEIYNNFSINMLIESNHQQYAEEYVHRVIMSMVSPVELKIQYDVSKTSYIKKLTALKTIEKSKDSEQMNVQPQLRTVNDANAIEKQEKTNNKQHQTRESCRQSTKQKLKNKIKENLSKDADRSNEMLIEKEESKYEMQVCRSSLNSLLQRKQIQRISEENLNEKEKYELINELIRRQTKANKKLKVEQILDYIAIINKNAQLQQAKKWFTAFLSKFPQIHQFLLCSGNTIAFKQNISNDYERCEQQQVDEEDGNCMGRMEEHLLQRENHSEEVHIVKRNSDSLNTLRLQ